MPEERGLRYETVVATLIGLLALCVSAYTAYVQREQVRAQVYPILEFSTQNNPKIGFWVANKGSGPALVRHVVITVDGKPIEDWNAMLRILNGPARYNYSIDSFGNRTLSPGEKLDVWTLNATDKEPLYGKLDVARFRVGAEICYCSTLGDCWTLKAPARETSNTVETPRCPETPAFRQ